MEQDLVLEKLPRVSAEHSLKGAKIFKKNSESTEKVTDKDKGSKDSAGNYEIDSHKNPPKTKVKHSRFTSHKRIRKSPK